MSIENPLKKEFYCFKVCCETLNISQAADLMGLGQSAVSKIVLQLEHTYQKKFFKRTSRGLNITADGQRLYDSIQLLEKEWTRSFIADKSIPGWKQSLTLGYHPAVARTLVPKIFPALNNLNPNFEFNSFFGTSAEITKKVNQLEIDVGFVVNPVKNPNLIPKKIRSEYVAIWKKRKNHAVLMYNPEMYLAPKIVSKLSQTYKLVPIHNYEVIAASIAEDVCHGILPNPMAQIYGFERLGSELLTLDLCLILHDSKFIAKDKKELIQFFLKAFQEL